MALFGSSGSMVNPESAYQGPMGRLIQRQFPEPEEDDPRSDWFPTIRNSIAYVMNSAIEDHTAATGGGHALSGALPSWVETPGLAGNVPPGAPVPTHESGWFKGMPKTGSIQAPRPTAQQAYLGSSPEIMDDRVFMGDFVQTNDLRDASENSGVDASTVRGLMETNVENEGTVRRPDAMLVGEALEQPYSWSEQELKEAYKKVRKAGIPIGESSGDVFGDFLQVWETLVARASKTFTSSQGKKLVTPWDILEIRKKEARGLGIDLGPEAEEQPFTGTRKTVNSSVQEISEGETWSVLQQTMSGLLGRDPTDQELRDFAFRANQMAAKNPQVSKTITQYEEGIATGANTTVTGGVSSADVAQEAYQDIQDDPDYGGFQAATSLMNALLGAVGPVV